MGKGAEWWLPSQHCAGIAFFFFSLHFISIWNLFKLSPKDFFSFLFMGFKLLLCAAMVPESCLI